MILRRSARSSFAPEPVTLHDGSSGHTGREPQNIGPIFTDQPDVDPSACQRLKSRRYVIGSGGSGFLGSPLLRRSRTERDPSVARRPRSWYPSARVYDKHACFLRRVALNLDRRVLR